MNKVLTATLAATALLAATPAVAGKSKRVTLPGVDETSMIVDGPTTVGTETTIGFTESGLDAPTFSEWLTFTNDMAGIYSITLDTSSPGIDFTSVILSGPGGNHDLLEAFDNGVTEFWQLSNRFLEAGTYRLTINGDNRSAGSLAGTVTVNSANAVPEPSTWGMMLLGFGAAGYAMRRRKTIAQLA